MLHHERFQLDERARHYEFEVIGATGQRCFAEAITVRPHPDGSLVELSGDAPSDDVAAWLDDLFVATLRSLTGLADEDDDR